MPAEGAHPWIVRHRLSTYRRISAGTVLVCAGAVLLLNSVGRVGWGVWFDLLRLWPLLLVSMGIRWIFAKTVLHQIVLIGPILLVAGTGLVVYQYARESAPEWSGETVRLSCPGAGSGGASRLAVNFEGGRLAIAAGAGDGKGEDPPRGRGLTGTLRYEGEEPPSGCGQAGTLRIGRDAPFADLRLLTPRILSRRWEARVASGSALNLDARITGATADLDLRAFRLREVDLRTMGARVTVRLGAPAGRVPLRLDGAASHVTLLVPDGTCWTLTRRPMLNLVSASGARRARLNAKNLSAVACPSTGSTPRYLIDFDLPVAAVRVATEGRGA